MRKLMAVILLIFSPVMVQAEEMTIAALGDSLTQGYGLPPEDGLVPQLQRWLDGQGAEVHLINAGVSGDTTAGGAARVGWTLTPDVDAMIVTLGGNDLLRGIDPASSRANLDEILTRLEAKDLPVLLAGLPAPLNYGEDWQRAFDAMYPELAEAHGALLYPDFMAAIGGFEDREQAMQLMQPDGIHPNAEGVKRIVAHIGPLVEDLIARADARD